MIGGVSSVKACLAALFLSVIVIDAYQPQQASIINSAKSSLAKMAASVTLATTLAFPGTALAADSSAAAQISLNSLPPSSVSIQIQDLPVIGKLISGTYMRVPDDTLLPYGGSSNTPSVVIKSPSDKLKAIKNIATGGHLEFDVSGKIQTHLDVDVAADKAGVAKIRVASSLIPRLPFTNLASSAAGSPTGGKESPWNMVVNMGTGETYYYNEKTGVTQFQKPDRF